MKKITAIAIVLLVCALLLGVGGGFLLASEKTASISGVPTLSGGQSSPIVFFDCPVDNPDCHPKH